MSIHLEIVTPSGSVVDSVTTGVTVPGFVGEFAVLENHIPLLAALKPGVVSFSDADGKVQRLAIGAGFAEVGASNRVLLLTDEHAFVDDIDVETVRGELSEADAALQAWTGEITEEHGDLERRARWAQARLDLAE